MFLLYRAVFRNQLFLQKTMLHQGMFLEIPQMNYRAHKKKTLKEDEDEF